MKLLAMADIHGHVKNIPLLANAAKDCDVILVAGDITDFGTGQQARSVLAALSDLGKPVLAVSGNCDPAEVDMMLKQKGVSLMKKPVQIDGVVFVGFPYPVPDAAIKNEPARQIPSQVPVVLVTHQPAWGTDLDIQAMTRHTGSRAVRSFIEHHQPRLAISGHIHEARGTDQLGSTVLVNPGPFRNGCYATIDLNGDLPVATLHCL